MSLFDRLDRHNALMHRMAGAIGVDLTETIVRGQLAAPDLRSMMFNCARCAAPGACGQFLDTTVPGTAEAPPGYCRNRDTLNRLAALDR